MKTFLQLYFKDYVLKILACVGFVFMFCLQGILKLYSIVHGFLVYPLVVLSLICTWITATADVIHFGALIGFAAIGLFAVLYRFAEPYLFGFTATIIENLKIRICRPVYLRSRVKFTI